MAKVAVVILNYNGLKFLQKFLPTVVDCSSEAEIYVVDNQSTDGSDIFITQEHPDLNLIVLESNLGYAGGYNQALKSIEAEYYILLNTDVEVTKNWIKPITDFMDYNVDIVACQPKILDYNNRDYFEYAGAAGGYLDRLGYPFCRGRVFDTLEKDEGQYDFKTQVFWATGACLFIRSDVFHELGGFDEDFFAHMEEIDLCWRINMSGKKIYCVPRSHVYHVGGGTLSKSNSKKTYFNFRNSLSMIYKNSSSAELFWKIPTKFVLDIAAALKLWKDNSFEHFLAVLSGYRDFAKQLPQLNKKRYNLKRYRNNQLSIKLSNFLLPNSYFIRKKKKYSDLIN